MDIIMVVVKILMTSQIHQIKAEKITTQVIKTKITMRKKMMVIKAIIKIAMTMTRTRIKIMMIMDIILEVEMIHTISLILHNKELIINNLLISTLMFSKHTKILSKKKISQNKKKK